MINGSPEFGTGINTSSYLRHDVDCSVRASESLVATALHSEHVSPQTGACISYVERKFGMLTCIVFIITL